MFVASKNHIDWPNTFLLDLLVPVKIYGSIGNKIAYDLTAHTLSNKEVED